MRERIQRGALLLFLVLLVASHIVRRQDEPRRPLRPGQQIMTLADGTELAYADHPANTPGAPTALVIHGADGPSFFFFDSWTPPRGGMPIRLLVPDLPGFGASTLELPGYSMRAQADRLAAFLDEHGVGRVHVIAAGTGAGVALYLAEKRNAQVASLLLENPRAVQEFDLLRDHALNKGLYAVQLFFLKCLSEGLPHFGLLDTAPANKPFARHFFDSDLRPLRAILENYDGPMQVVGDSPAAREIRRIVPQSETSDSLDLSLITDVEERAGVNRNKAEPDRVAAASGPIPSKRIHGMDLLLVVLLLALAMQSSEDLTCIGAGLLAAQGIIGFLPACAGCFLGILLGDSGIYAIGRFIGRPALRHRPFRWMISERKVNRTATGFERVGPELIAYSRFLPGTRVPLYFCSGLLRLPFWKFFLFLSIGGVLWTPFLVGLSCLFGAQFLIWLEHHESLALVAVIGFVLCLYLLIHLGLPLFTYRGRRMAVSRWRRLSRWEYWPPWIFYPPVVAYVALRAVRHRSVALITAVNPGIPSGGLVRETKSQILGALREAGDAVARWTCIPAAAEREEKRCRLQAFMEEAALEYPLVLKPDIGLRGTGVAIVRSEAEAEEYLAAYTEDVIAQEYVSGAEYGVFYYRYPSQDRGHVFSITDKRLIEVTGDGTRPLERLILDDDRAVGMARFFLRQFSDRLMEIPAAGERVALTELGTHCRGSLFLDGGELISEALETRIDGISKTFDGFYFGRYDIRVPDAEALREGRGIRILELNGLTAEATHIYDPKHGLRYAYRTLVRQWRIAFEIAEENRQRGVVPMRHREMLRLLLQFARNPVPEVPGTEDEA